MRAKSLGHLQNGHALPAAHVDVAKHGLSLLTVSGQWQAHGVCACSGHVVHVEEFAPWCAGAPDGDAGRVVDLGFVKATDQRWDDVGVFQVVVVAGAG